MVAIEEMIAKASIFETMLIRETARVYLPRSFKSKSRVTFGFPMMITFLIRLTVAGYDSPVIIVMENDSKLTILKE